MLLRLFCLLFGHDIPDPEPIQGYWVGWCATCDRFAAKRMG
ncbi:MAG TPA: hypothetical protein VHG72_14005 [Polyangia bacterium]|nr:hypothetical protein [Polyangia bacterium]